MKPALLILAAGMGSRYGGLKQLDAMGPNGETILDYSVKFAAEAGFGKVVLVVRKHMESDVRRIIFPRYDNIIDMECVFQELDILPEGFSVNPERVKPYGTAHAILMAKDAIKEPFTVINADDFYGRESFFVMADFLKKETAVNERAFSMIGYRLRDTLSEFGTVSRGVCTMDHDGLLLSVDEMRKISNNGGKIQNIENGTTTDLTGDEFVSMNFWGFSPLIFKYLEELLIDFLNKNKDNITAEYPIPDVVSYLLKHGIVDVKVLPTTSEWFGVTYPEDRPAVVEKLKRL